MKIVWKNTDNEWRIVTLANEARSDGETDADFAARMSVAVVPQGLAWQVPDEAMLQQIYEDIAQQAEKQSRVPSWVTPRQIRLALHSMGLLASVTQWIAVAPEDVQIEWEFTEQIFRNHNMWQAGAKALGKTDTDIDALFQLAATL